MTFVYLFLFALLFTGCEDKLDSCYEEIEEGSATVRYDDVMVNYNSSWIKTGSTLQVNLEGSDVDGMVTIRLIESIDGVTLDSLNDGVPYVYELGNLQSATATFYPSSSDGNSSTAQAEDPGTFTIVSYDEQVLTACFSFTAVDQQGTSHNLLDGLIHAPKNNIGE